MGTVKKDLKPKIKEAIKILQESLKWIEIDYKIRSARSRKSKAKKTIKEINKEIKKRRLKN